jgi:hypothetical protein
VERETRVAEIVETVRQLEAKRRERGRGSERLEPLKPMRVVVPVAAPQ